MSEDDRWLDVLAGRAPGGPADAEARALRRLINTQLREDAYVVAEVDASRQAELVARARAVGLLPPADVARFKPRAHRTTLWMGGGLAATALIASVLVGWYRLSVPPSETYRSMQGGTVRLVSRNPAELKRTLIRELREVGIQATGYDRLDRVGLDAELPTPVPSGVRQVLERHHIPIPDDSALVIEIVAADTR
jgi:hypothetical protein